MLNRVKAKHNNTKPILLKHNEEPQKNFYYIGFCLDTTSNRQYFRLYNERDLGFNGTIAEFTIDTVITEQQI